MTSQYRSCLKMTLVRLQDKPDEDLKSEVYDLLVQNPPPSKVQSANNSLLETSLKGGLKVFTCDLVFFVAVNVNVCNFFRKILADRISTESSESEGKLFKNYYLINNFTTTV